MGKIKTVTIENRNEIEMKTSGKRKKNQKKEKIVNSKKNVKKTEKNVQRKSATKKIKNNESKTKKESSKVTPCIKIPIKKEKKKIKIEKHFLSKDKKDELKRLVELFSLKNTNDLKDLLKKNNQKISGNKSELVERCSEGKLLGALPNCPKCFGGKLRFNIITGEYYCPGYMEDTTMINCNFKSYDIKRNGWLD